MVGIRVEPDDNDLVVWRMDEAAAPFVNSSTSPSAPSNSDLTTLSGNVALQQPSLFAPFGTGSCIRLSGNNSGSPRNFISGANSFMPQPPLTVSCWMIIRAYNTTNFTQHTLVKQTTTGVWSGTTFGSINFAQNRQYTSLPTHFDFFVSNNASGQGGNAVAVNDVNIPLNVWSHVGMTYDGTTVQSFINGQQVGSGTASPGGNIYYSGTPGPWFVGAIPSGSGNPEESNTSVCDIRIADVIRPLSYFQNIYRQGTQNPSGQVSVITTFYKMRAYDVYLRTTPVYWVDTAVNYNNAPASPSGLGLGPIEILESWNLLNI